MTRKLCVTGLFQPSYLDGLITMVVPPKLRSLLFVAAIIAAATAPPAASNRAARAPPLRPLRVSGRVSRVQRVPGCGAPAHPDDPAVPGVDLQPAPRPPNPLCDPVVKVPTRPL